jgi:hypothetical protein
VAVGIGRGVRYFGEALLALWYGERAIDYLQTNGTRIFIILAVAIAIFAAVWLFLRRRRASLAGGDTQS